MVITDPGVARGVWYDGFMRWSEKLGACYLEVGRHKFRVWDNGPMAPEPVHRIPVCSSELPPEKIAKIYDEIMDFLR